LYEKQEIPMVKRARGWIASTLILLATGIGLTTAVYAACYQPKDKLPQDQIQGFFNNPTELLAKNPSGGGGLESSILKLVGSDDAALPAVIKLLSSANPQQRTAIGAGLAAAAQLCLASDPSFAGQIQSAVAEAGDRVALEAFVSSGGQDTATASIGTDAPGATAFVSGFAQVTGNSNVNSTPLFLPTGGSSGGRPNFLTFNGSSSRGSGSTSCTSCSTSP
jgi:hypothetical protein